MRSERCLTRKQSLCLLYAMEDLSATEIWARVGCTSSVASDMQSKLGVRWPPNRLARRKLARQIFFDNPHLLAPEFGQPTLLNPRQAAPTRRFRPVPSGSPSIPLGDCHASHVKKFATG